jgi:serine/threonine-protein kinase
MSGAAVFLIAFFTSVLSAIGAVYIVERLHVFDAPRVEVPVATVPVLQGQTEQDARANLQALALGLFVVGRESDKTAKPETVLRQSVPPGQKVEAGSVINVVLAEPVFEMPDLVGKTREEAEAILKKAGLEVSYGEPMPHATVAAGSIAAQSRRMGASFRPGDEVELRASAGPAEVEVPKLVGLSLANAQKQLTAAGLGHAVRWVDMAETASYVVLRQEPKEGTKAKPNDVVTLFINRD